MFDIGCEGGVISQVAQHPQEGRVRPVLDPYPLPLLHQASASVLQFAKRDGLCGIHRAISPLREQPAPERIRPLMAACCRGVEEQQAVRLQKPQQEVPARGPACRSQHHGAAGQTIGASLINPGVEPVEDFDVDTVRLGPGFHGIFLVNFYTGLYNSVNQH